MTENINSTCTDAGSAIKLDRELLNQTKTLQHNKMKPFSGINCRMMTIKLVVHYDCTLSIYHYKMSP